MIKSDCWASWVSENMKKVLFARKIQATVHMGDNYFISTSTEKILCIISSISKPFLIYDNVFINITTNDNYYFYHRPKLNSRNARRELHIFL